MADVDVELNRLNHQAKLLISAMDQERYPQTSILERFQPEWIRERLMIIEQQSYLIKVILEYYELEKRRNEL